MTKSSSGGNLGLSREYHKKLFGPLLYPCWNCPLTGVACINWIFAAKFNCILRSNPNVFNESIFSAQILFCIKAAENIATISNGVYLTIWTI